MYAGKLLALGVIISTSVALCAHDSARAADDDKNPNECVVVGVSGGKSQMKNKCDFKINVRWKDDATCKDWRCTGSIGPRASIAIPDYNVFIAFRVCRHPQAPTADSGTNYCS